MANCYATWHPDREEGRGNGFRTVELNGLGAGIKFRSGGDGLENRYSRKAIVGSNPTLSATAFWEPGCPVLLPFLRLGGSKGPPRQTIAGARSDAQIGERTGRSCRRAASARRWS